VNYVQNEKRYTKKENAILLYSDKPFRQAAIKFLRHRHFKRFVIVTSSKIEATVKKYLLDTGWHNKFAAFQGARLNHVRVKFP